MKTRNIVVAVVVAVLLVLGASVLSCRKPQPEHQQNDILVIADVRNIENALITVAYEQKFFEQQHLEIVRRTFPSGKQALDAMAGGQADVAVSAETPVVWAVLRGESLAILATLNETVNKATARKRAGILKPRDLAGKRVAVLAG